jgi:hypothetical protein
MVSLWSGRQEGKRHVIHKVFNAMGPPSRRCAESVRPRICEGCRSWFVRGQPQHFGLGGVVDGGASGFHCQPGRHSAPNRTQPVRMVASPTRSAARPPGRLHALREPDAIARATATDPKELTRQQAAVAHWLSKRYKVAPEPISRLVQEAWVLGERVGLEPTLLLAIMAIESGFNPFAQSPVGAQGLMQVMTRIHDEKYEAFGGTHAAFDPITNLRVGVLVLKECISRAGSLEQGLRFYVGAANLPDDGGYAGKVLGEQAHLRNVLIGRTVSVNAPIIVPATQLPTIPVMEQAKDGALQEKPPAPEPEQVALLKRPAG